ncbi:MAG: hypothetical protein ACI8RZ_002189 [Myxococcota bacterium]|jgi:hypothetical protein
MILLLLGCPPPEPPPEEAEPEPALRVMAQGEPIALSTGRFSSATPLYTGSAAMLWEANADRALLYALSDTEPILPTGGLLLATDGTDLGEIPIPREVDWALGVAIARESGNPLPALIRLEDGAILTTELTLPDGSPATDVRLFLSESVLVAARGASGEAFYGTFGGDGEPDLSPLPLWPIAMSIEGDRIEAWSERGVPGSEGDCVRYRLDGDTPKCRMVSGDATTDSWPLSERWTAVGSWTGGVQLYRDTQPIPWRLEEDCRWTISATLESPPRVLAECHPDRSSPERLRRLWSPDWERAWSQQLPPSHRGSFLTRPMRHPILPEPIPDVTPTLAEHWIDLVAGERWQSPLLSPLSYDGMPRPGLGRDPHTGGVVVLDFDSGVYHPVTGAGEDCHAELKEMGRDHGLILLTCRSRPNPSFYRFIHHWSMVVDLENKRAWKLDQLPEAIIGPTTILVSDRQKTQAEGYIGFTSLNRLELE